MMEGQWHLLIGVGVCFGLYEALSVAGGIDTRGIEQVGLLVGIAQDVLHVGLCLVGVVGEGRDACHSPFWREGRIGKETDSARCGVVSAVGPVFGWRVDPIVVWHVVSATILCEVLYAPIDRLVIHEVGNGRCLHAAPRVTVGEVAKHTEAVNNLLQVIILVDGSCIDARFAHLCSDAGGKADGSRTIDRLRAVTSVVVAASDQQQCAYDSYNRFESHLLFFLTVSQSLSSRF